MKEVERYQEEAAECEVDFEQGFDEAPYGGDRGSVGKGRWVIRFYDADFSKRKRIRGENLSALGWLKMGYWI
jgi:hypothetical protein